MDNSVNGRILSKCNPLLGQDSHEEQVIPDHHQVTVQNKDVIKIGVECENTVHMWENRKFDKRDEPSED